MRLAGAAAERRLRALVLATTTARACAWALLLLLCGSGVAAPAAAGKCGPRPDADCFYAAFSARAPPRAAPAATATADPPGVVGFLPFAANAAGGANATATASDASWSWSSYHGHDAMLAFLSRLVNDSAGSCRLDWLYPASVEGRRMVAVVVGSETSTGGDSSLPKPSFTWIGNMHGDETANRELLLRLAAAMCSGELAAADAGWRELQESTVVRIIPTMNPDGFAARRRLNSRNVDLNRNFWTPAFPYAPPPANLAMAEDVQGAPKYPAAASWSLVGNFSLQPEAQAVASYLSYTLPDLSANLHGGALVANYPLDACDSLGAQRSCPTGDEPVPRLLAAAYSQSNPGMAANGAAPFVGGTVQGAQWYPVLGSLQDWVYHQLQRLHTTLELHPVKDPPAASLPSLWEANRAAMLRLMQLARMGLRARVLDAASRRSLAANVTVAAPAGVRGLTTDGPAAAAAAAAERRGYFFKPMAPGIEYEFVVQPYDPDDVGVSYDVISFRASLSVGREEVVAAAAAGEGGVGPSLRGLAIERVLLAFRSNSTTSVKK